MVLIIEQRKKSSLTFLLENQRRRFNRVTTPLRPASRRRPRQVSKNTFRCKGRTLHALTPGTTHRLFPMQMSLSSDVTPAVLPLIAHAHRSEAIFHLLPFIPLSKPGILCKASTDVLSSSLRFLFYHYDPQPLRPHTHQPLLRNSSSCAAKYRSTDDKPVSRGISYN